MNPDDAQHCAVPASAVAVIACVGFTGTTLSLISIGAIFPPVNSIGGSDRNILGRSAESRKAAGVDIAGC